MHRRRHGKRSINFHIIQNGHHRARTSTAPPPSTFDLELNQCQPIYVTNPFNQASTSPFGKSCRRENWKSFVSPLNRSISWVVFKLPVTHVCNRHWKSAKILSTPRKNTPATKKKQHTPFNSTMNTPYQEKCTFSIRWKSTRRVTSVKC